MSNSRIISSFQKLHIAPFFLVIDKKTNNPGIIFLRSSFLSAFISKRSFPPFIKNIIKRFYNLTTFTHPGHKCSHMRNVLLIEHLI